jgi:hypothetical protein
VADVADEGTTTGDDDLDDEPSGDLAEGVDEDAFDEDDEFDEDEDDEFDEDEDEDARPGLSPRPDGPWDVSERPDAEGLIDLGTLRLRGADGMELRLEMEEPSKLITTATVQLGGSVLQLQAFAAPRSEGIWPEISAEIAASLTKQGGTVQEEDGPYGRQLRARIPVRTSDGRSGQQRALFIGVDGPRWFLRAVLHGPAAQRDEAAEPLLALFREVVVVRGAEAMAPRDLLPLRLPAETGAETGSEAGTEEDPDGTEGGSRPPLDPFRRGPEITEVR